MGSSRYQQIKHKRIIGMVDTVRASKCASCGHLVTSAEMFKGWCASCIASWGATANHAVIAAGVSAHAAAQQRPEPPTARSYERLKDRIAERRPDAWFIPMLLYIGGQSIGQMQANWNFLQAMYELEVMTTGQAFKLGKESHDVLHICGRHAPMASMSLGGFISRVINSPEVWNDVEPQMRNYIREFIHSQGGNFLSLCGPRQRIDRYAEPGTKTRRSWRRDANYKSRASKKTERIAWEQKYGGVIKPVPNFWPFAVRQAPTEHEMLNAIDHLTRGIPEQWRQDVCQDLVVAVLAGEVTLNNLKDALPEYVRGVFHAHPMKYGDLSIDHPSPWSDGDKDRTLADVLSSYDYVDTSVFESRCSVHDDPDIGQTVWHEGWDRPRGLSTIGQQLREKNGGAFVPNLQLPPEESGMDAEIADVFRADKNPRGYRPLREQP